MVFIEKKAFFYQNSPFKADIYPMNKQLERVRIDKWLWAARFYKTRQLAIKAIKNNQISLNGQTVKPATHVKLNDRLRIQKGVFELEVSVLGLLEKRVSAAIAQTLYEETSESASLRKQLKEQLANQPRIDIDHRKPDKRGVRTHRAFKRGE